jgi:periplasmic protein TonB
VIEAEPAGSFEEDARRTFQSAQFRPALKNGRPVKSRILVQLEYGNPGTASQ